ncbi:MAG: hypothetical protein JWP11_31 [Frankiales bacterium]|nr:hypothetical protein [Frankiales bacterium]
MIVAVYDIGDTALVDLEVKVLSDPTDPESDLVLADPTSVSLLLLSPAGEQVAADVEKMSVGIYRAAYNPVVSGVWRYRWVTVGTGSGGQDGSFVVRPLFSWLPVAADVRNEMTGRKLDRISDDEIEELIARRAASLQAELPTTLAPRLQPVARDYLLYAVSSIIEDRLYPEQANQPESNAVRLDRRAGAELVRLRGQLGENATSGQSDWSGSVSLHRDRSWRYR